MLGMQYTFLCVAFKVHVLAPSREQARRYDYNYSEAWSETSQQTENHASQCTVENLYVVSQLKSFPG